LDNDSPSIKKGIIIGVGKGMTIIMGEMRKT